jgi:site-specific recombinase XerD
MSERTAYLYSRDITHFVQYVGQDVPIVEVAPGDIVDFIKSDNASYSVMRRRYYALRSLYKEIGLSDLIETITMPGQTGFDSPPVTREHLPRLLGAVSNGYTTYGPTIGIREKTIAHLAYSLLSPSDMLNLLVSDVNLDFGIIFYDGKMIPLSTNTRNVLAFWLYARRQLGPEPSFLTSTSGKGLVGDETIRVTLLSYSHAVVGVGYTTRNFHAARFRDDILALGDDVPRLSSIWGLSENSVYNIIDDMKANGELD